jgi:voltage-gated potassium channel
MVSFALTLRNLVRAVRGLWRDPERRGLVVLALSTLATGTTFYTVVEHWSVVDSLYFSVTTLTTVGLGDFVPTTTGAKLFTIVYVLVGIGILVALVTALGEALIAQRSSASKIRLAPGTSRSDGD